MTEELFRGIKKSDYIIDNCVKIDVFPFSCAPNEDGYIEESINWNDDSGALDEIRLRRKEDMTIEFQGGVCVMNIDRMNKILGAQIHAGNFDFNHELDPNNPENIYHGNLCMKAGLHDHIKKTIKFGLTLTIENNIVNPPDDNN